MQWTFQYFYLMCMQVLYVYVVLCPCAYVQAYETVFVMDIHSYS